MQNYSLSATRTVNTFIENTVLAFLSQAIQDGQVVWMFESVHRSVKSMPVTVVKSTCS